MSPAAQRPIVTSWPCEKVCDCGRTENETGAFFCMAYGLNFDECPEYALIMRIEDRALQVAALIGKEPNPAKRREEAIAIASAYIDTFDVNDAELDEDAFLARCGVHVHGQVTV